MVPTEGPRWTPPGESEKKPLDPLWRCEICGAEERTSVPPPCYGKTIAHPRTMMTFVPHEDEHRVDRL